MCMKDKEGVLFNTMHAIKKSNTIFESFDNKINTKRSGSIQGLLAPFFLRVYFFQGLFNRQILRYFSNVSLP